MIKSFRTSDTQLLFDRQFVRAFAGFERQALKRLRLLHRAESLTDLSAIWGNRLEALKGDREGQFSIRIKISTASASDGMVTMPTTWK